MNETDSLIAAFQIVERMTVAECVQFYRAHVGRGLDRETADIFQHVAARLGVKIVWQTFDFRTWQWNEGRRSE